MGRKDTLTKEYMSRNDIFADVFNYILYDGHAIIQPDNLIDKDITEIALPIGKNGEIIPIQKYRDILKGYISKESSDAIYVLLGIENQAEIHYAMPVKNLLYDALNYASQVTQKASEYRKTRKEQKDNKVKQPFKETAAEFLSGFHKTDKLKPVITITIYFGVHKWDAPRNLREMFCIQQDSIIQYIPNYSINLIAPTEIKDFEQFHSEFGRLMHIIGVSEKQKEMDRLLSEQRSEFSEMSRTAVEILNEFIGLSFDIPEQEDTMNICKAWEDQKKICIQEGIRQGHLSGLEEGREKERKNLALQMHKEGLPNDIIARVLQISVENVKSLLL